MLGERLGNYLVTGKLGEGGMGSVYAAQHVLLGRHAALKVLLPALSSHQDMIERFFNEARATAAIRHPGIVEIYDFGYHVDGSAFIAMELLPGHPLAQRIARGPAPVPDALHIARQIAAALQAAHEAGVIHRDLKPDNVFVVSDAELGLRIKLLDFGIAKLATGSLAMRKTQTGSLIGTPAYMAPEQCRGVAVDHRADIYALGCILFELLAGRPPFDGEGAGDLLAAHIHVAPPPPSRFAPAVPPAIDALVLRLLSKDPAARPASARDVYIDLDLALAGAQAAPRTWPGTAAAPTIAMTTTLTGAASEIHANTGSHPGAGRSTVTGAGAQRSLWRGRGIGFAAGALALVLATGGVWIARGSAGTGTPDQAAATPAGPTWAAPAVSAPDTAVSGSDSQRPETRPEPESKPEPVKPEPETRLKPEPVPAPAKPAEPVRVAGSDTAVSGSDSPKPEAKADAANADAKKADTKKASRSRALSRERERERERERRHVPAPPPEPSPDRSINPFD